VIMRANTRNMLDRITLVIVVAALGWLAPAAAHAQLVADDFNDCALDPAWKFVDPLSQFSAPVMTGTYTDDAHVALTVPSGQIYQFWNGSNEPPYILQPAVNADMTLEVKFDSVLPAVNITTEGIVAYENSDSWVRAEFYSRDDGLVRAAVDVGLTTSMHDVLLPSDVSVPLYMRLERVGDTWTQSWRDDGLYTSWTVVDQPFVYAMTVSGAGVYAGNNLTAPSHTVQVDYFSITPGAPTAEDSVKAPLDVTIVGGGGLVSVVRSPDKTTYGCDELVTLTATLAAGWAFSGWSGDIVSTDNPATITMNGAAAVTATFVPATTFALDVTIVGGGSVTLDPPGGIYADGTTVTLTANEPAGWTFDSWTGDLTGATNPETLLIDGNKSATATFSSLAEYILTLNIFGDGSVTADPQPEPGGFYYDGTLVELTAVPDTGMQLDAWSGDLTGTTNPETILIDGDKTVAATFGVIPPAFDFDDFNACSLDPMWTFVDPLSQFAAPVMTGTYTQDAGVSLTVPAGQIYQFWSGTNEPPYIQQPANDTDMTLEVKFDSALPAVSIATEGIVVRENALSWVRAEFYTRDDGLVRAAVDLGVTTTVHDVTLPADVSVPIYMRLERVGDTWTQSWRDDGNHTSWTVVDDPFNYAMNVLEVGVYAGNNNTTPAHTVQVDYFTYTDGPPAGEDSLRAPLDITMVGGGGLTSVTRDPDKTTYGCDEPVTLTANEVVGWIFGGWSGDLVSFDNPAVISMNGAAAVTATFAPAVTHTLDLTLVGGGTVILDPPGGTYNTGTVVTLTAGDGPGWTFGTWTGDLTGSTNPETIVMDGNKSVTATFDAVSQFPLTVSELPPGSGTVTLDPPGGSYNSGTSVTVTAAPTAGWSFDGWTGDLTGSVNPETVVVDAPKTVTANFTSLAQYTLTVVPTGSGSVTTNPAPEPGGFYYDGTLVELTATPDPDWQFDGWGGDLVGTATPDTLLIDGDKTLTATFSVIPPAIVEDDFSDCDLDPIWTFDDPLADGGAYAMVGTFTQDAGVAISVAAGPSKHQLFNGAISAPNILQPAGDTDVTVDVKFDSALPAGYAQEGVFFRQDAAEFVGFEFYSNSSGQPYAYVRLPDDSVVHNLPVGAPGDSLSMRIDRAGDDWTQFWSADGVTFTQVGGSFTYALNVTGFGCFAGNTGSTPVAHTVMIDYVSYTGGPPVDEDILRNILTIDIAGNGDVIRTPDLPSYGCDETVVLSAVPDLGWQFDGWSGALTGAANPDSVVMSGSQTVSAVFSPSVWSTVAANTDGVGCLSTVDVCLDDIPFMIDREELTGLRSYSVTFALENLQPCDGLNSITEGDYLSSIGTTQFQVVDNLDGTWTVDAAIQGFPCGVADSTGVLFFLDAAGTIPDGTGTITVTSVALGDCNDDPVPAYAGDPATVQIDGTGPAVVVTNLLADRLMAGNLPDSTTAVVLAWDAIADPDVVGIEIYRKGFGTYPEYDDTGSAPVQPTAPAAEGWDHVVSLPAGSVGYQDLAQTRDYWNYVAVLADSCGNASAPSEMSAGTLNYLLGDLREHATVADSGDNIIGPYDMAYFVGRYGTEAGSGLYDPALDFGPTSDVSGAGLPSTDDIVEFEDLMIIALGYGTDAVAGTIPDPLTAPDPAPANRLILTAPAPPAPGQSYSVSLAMTADGEIYGLSIPLTWDPAVVAPVAMVAGDLYNEQVGPGLILSPTLGTVDFGLIGPRDLGLSGEGFLATVTFNVLTAGDPNIGLGTIRARDENNQPIALTGDVTTDVPGADALPAVMTLHLPAPNPFNPSTKVSFDVAQPGRVTLKIYAIDGRLVRTLTDGAFTPGRYSETWNGTDDRGRGVATGTYIARLMAPGGSMTRRMVLLK
jgi:uncharacterized repeat protein (TIGR02543 family)